MSTIGVEFYGTTRKVKKIVHVYEIMRDISHNILEELDLVMQAESEIEQMPMGVNREHKLEEINLSKQRSRRLYKLMSKAAKILGNTLKEIMDRLPPQGPILVECLGASTIKAVQYVNHNLRTMNSTVLEGASGYGFNVYLVLQSNRLFPVDTGVVVYREDWSVNEIQSLVDIAAAARVNLVWTTKEEHPLGPSANHVKIRDSIRELKMQTSTYNLTLKEIQKFDEKIKKNAAKRTEMNDNGADPHELFKQEVELRKWKILLSQCHVSLEAALTNVKRISAELLQSGYSGDEIDEARSTIRRRG